MSKSKISRRRFISTASAVAMGSAAFGINTFNKKYLPGKSQKETVSIARIRGNDISGAVEEAIDLLGGIEAATAGKQKIMLKPNLVIADFNSTTKVEVVKTLARLMQQAGKLVSIGEGSAAGVGFNVINDEIFKTKKREILDKLQQDVFDTLGYTEMTKSLNIPLVNLHSGDITEVSLKNGYAAKSVKIHRSLTEIDLLCSVPVMKTHNLATVTLAMKNLIGLYPGTEYYSVRSWLHDKAAEAGSPGIAYEIIDMNNAVKTGLSVIDASTAMEGDGPTGGTLVEMGLIIAGTSPLAADMVGAWLMGFEPEEIPAIVLAHQSGMTPATLGDIEIKGVRPDQCRRKFIRPNVYNWFDIREGFGAREL
jgi:uncharacterized protein (DUF362 family)